MQCLISKFTTALRILRVAQNPLEVVSSIAVGHLFQLPPVIVTYSDMNHSEYAILAPNLWNKLFKMFELDEIMRQRESKEFAEMLNRLREGKHTEQRMKK